MKLFKRTYSGLVNSRERLLTGKVNCIPWGMPRFETISPGIEQGRYYMVTASTKVGKSQLTDQLFLYNPYRYYLANRESFRLKIFYFSLEMSDTQKMQQAISNLMFHNSNSDRFSTMDLRSVREPLSEETIQKIASQEEYFNEFEKVVTYISHIKNPTGIYKYMKEYALRNGKWIKKPGITKDGSQGLVNSHYEPNDPDEYVIVILDHASLLSPERGADNLAASISKLSSEYFVELRNLYNYTPVLIQQQAASQESLENVKFKSVKPSFTGLADNKRTSRDVDLALGLYTPIRYGFKSYVGYDINFFKDNIRFLEIIGGREGGGGIITPLFFDGAVNYFNELPKPPDVINMQKVYDYICQLRNKPPVVYSSNF